MLCCCSLDADGFPVSVPAGDLADQTEEFEETQLLFVDGSVGSIQVRGGDLERLVGWHTLGRQCRLPVECWCMLRFCCADAWSVPAYSLTMEA